MVEAIVAAPDPAGAVKVEHFEQVIKVKLWHLPSDRLLFFILLLESLCFVVMFFVVMFGLTTVLHNHIDTVLMLLNHIDTFLEHSKQRLNIDLWHLQQLLVGTRFLSFLRLSV